MARNNVVGLKPKSSSKDNFNVKVDAELLAELKQLEDRIEKDFPDLSFSRADVVEGALSTAIKIVTAELDRRNKPAAQLST